MSGPSDGPQNKNFKPASIKEKMMEDVKNLKSARSAASAAQAQERLVAAYSLNNVEKMNNDRNGFIGILPHATELNSFKPTLSGGEYKNDASKFLAAVESH